jgi:hypothetical protein
MSLVDYVSPARRAHIIHEVRTTGSFCGKILNRKVYILRDFDENDICWTVTLRRGRSGKGRAPTVAQSIDDIGAAIYAYLWTERKF